MVTSVPTPTGKGSECAPETYTGEVAASVSPASAYAPWIWSATKRTWLGSADERLRLRQCSWEDPLGEDGMEMCLMVDSADTKLTDTQKAWLCSSADGLFVEAPQRNSPAEYFLGV